VVNLQTPSVRVGEIAAFWWIIRFGSLPHAESSDSRRQDDEHRRGTLSLNLLPEVLINSTTLFLGIATLRALWSGVGPDTKTSQHTSTILTRSFVVTVSDRVGLTVVDAGVDSLLILR
jgi:hypothetical protein